MTREGPELRVRAEEGSADIELPETPTSGYRWELAQLSEVPEGAIVTDRFLQESAGGQARLVGGQGAHVFSLRGLPPGNHRLEFLLRRPWESEPLERRTVTVEAN